MQVHSRWEEAVKQGRRVSVAPESYKTILSSCCCTEWTSRVKVSFHTGDSVRVLTAV